MYTSTRAIQPDEELCIFYGHQLWFDPVDGPPRTHSDLDDTTDPWGGLADIQHHDTHMDDVVQETDLPFTWKRLGLEKEEERLDEIELGNHNQLPTLLLTHPHTVQAWVVDIPDQTHIATMLR